jgi:hypothetical protein
MYPELLTFCDDFRALLHANGVVDADERADRK